MCLAVILGHLALERGYRSCAQIQSKEPTQAAGDNSNWHEQFDGMVEDVGEQALTVLGSPAPFVRRTAYTEDGFALGAPVGLVLISNESSF